MAKTVGKFAALNRHQLAGHVANLEFWVGEVRHAISLVDEYPRRLRRMVDAQEASMRPNSTLMALGDGKGSGLEPGFHGGGVEQVVGAYRLEDRELRAMRQAVSTAFVRFLRRSCKEGLVDERVAKQLFRELNIDWEAIGFP